MDTTAWTAMQAAFVDYLLAFVASDSSTLADILEARFYCGTAPDNAVTPYAEVRFVNFTTTDGSNMDRADFQAEIQLFGRPRDSQALPVERAADVICGALKQWHDSSSGLIKCVGLQRDQIPPFTDPADRRYYQVRVLASLFVWPRFLTQYSHPAGA